MDAERRVALPAAPVLRGGADLLLRRHHPGDLEGVVEQCQDEAVQRWTTVPAPYTRADAEDFLRHVEQVWAAGTAASFAIEVDGRFAGSIDLRLEEGAWGDVGFGLAPWARGRGVMSRSLRLVLTFGFTECALAGVHWRAHVGNEASWRVARACGFQLEGTARGLLVERGRRVDVWIGSILASEHPAPAAGSSAPGGASGGVGVGHDPVPTGPAVLVATTRGERPPRCAAWQRCVRR